MLDAVLALNGLDTRVFDSVDTRSAQDNGADYITVPDAHLLFNGEFKRVGSDGLKITGENGESFFIANYFNGEKHKHLLSPEGAQLSASVVEALAGPLAPGQQAQAGAQPAAQAAIGRVDAMTGSCTVVRNGVSVALNMGDTVRKGDVVQTSSASTISIVFTDGSTFSLSANARMVLDEFVFNAGGSNNSAVINLVQGTFSFVAGQVAKTGDMKVETPVATMGIRGTAVLVEISANDGRTKFSVMVEPNGTTGSFNLYNKTTGALIATVNNSNIGWVVTPVGPLQVVAEQTQKTPAELQQELNIVEQLFTIFNNFQQNPIDQQQDPDRRGDNQNGPQNAGPGGSGAPLTTGQQNNYTVTISQIDNSGFQKQADYVNGNPNSNNNNGTNAGTGFSSGNEGGTDTQGTGNQSDQQVPLPTGTYNYISGTGVIVGTPGKDYIVGSSQNDTITALEGDDEVYAQAGDDIVIAGHGEGNDFYDGGPGYDAIKYESTALGVTFNLDVGSYTLSDGTVVSRSTADGTEIGHDEFVQFEKIVGSPGNDIFILHSSNYWEIDGGAGIDILRLDGNVGLTQTSNIYAYNIEILDMNQDFANTIYVEPSDVWYALGQDPTSSGGSSSQVFRVLGGSSDVINFTNTYQIAGQGQFHIGSWQLVGTFVDPSIDNATGDPFNDHLTDGVTFQQYAFVSDTGTVLSTVYVQQGIQIYQNQAQGSATDDWASMGENEILRIDVLANDSPDATTTKTLLSLGTASIVGPNGVTLGNPAIVIEDNRIRITPGTAFDALAVGETATITIPYTMQIAGGGTYTATATIVVTGANNSPYFALLPDGYSTLGNYTTTSFGGVSALELTSQGASLSQIEAFLGLDAGTLQGINSQTTDGAAMAFQLTLAAGESISFSWNFASTEYEPFNDYAFFSVSSSTGIKLSDIYSIGDSVNDGYLHSTGWQTYTYTATASGQYLFGIGTMNTIDSAFNSHLYLAGFSGIGFSRTVTESASLQTFNLLNGAYDPDTHDTLSATNIVVTAKDQYGNIIDITGAYSINGASLSIDPNFFSYLNNGQNVTIVATYDVSDGHTAIHNSATLIVNGEGSVTPPTNSLPVANAVSAIGDEDGLLPVEIVLQGSDTDGYLLGFKVTSLPSHGTLYSDEALTQEVTVDTLISASGTSKKLYFKPAADWNGDTQFNYVAVDNNQAQSSAAATASIHVNSLPEGEVNVYVSDADGFDTEHFGRKLAAGEITHITDTSITLLYNDGSNVFQYTVQGTGIEWTGEIGEIQLTAGTLTDIFVYRMIDLYPVYSAGLNGFDIDAHALQSAINAANQQQPSYTAIDALFADYQYYITAYSGSDNLVGSDFNDLLDGGSGTNTLTGNGGADIFVYSGGNDTITDFKATESDKIDLTAFNYIHDMTDIGPRAHQDGADTVITFDNDETLRLKNVTLNDLSDADFVFYTPYQVIERGILGIHEGNQDSAATTYQVISSDGSPATFDNTGWTAIPTDASQYGYDGHYYKFISGSLSWTAAQAAALAMGGYLATISDSYENAFVHGLVGSTSAWIGATDASTEGHWIWSDGPEGGEFNGNGYYAYTGWWGAEPNGGTAENYAFIDHNGYWTDVPNAPSGQDYEVTGYVVEFNGQGYIKTGIYGTAIFDPTTGELTYTLNNGDADTQALAVGQTATDTFELTFIDEHDHVVTKTATFTIEGSNDKPVIFVADGDSASATLCETDDGLTASGSLHVIDVDANSSLTASVHELSASGSYGFSQSQLEDMLDFLTVSLDANGKLDWSFNSGDEAFNLLGENNSLTLHYTVRVTDEHGAWQEQVVDITINGENDAPELPETFGSAEGNAGSSITFTLTATDDSSGVKFSMVDAEQALLLGTFQSEYFSSNMTADNLRNIFDSNSNNGEFTHRVYFTPYDPGDYSFTFTATDSDGTSADSSASVSLHAGPRIVQQTIGSGQSFDADDFYPQLGGATIDFDRSSQYELWLFNSDDGVAFKLGGNFTFDDAQNPTSVESGNVTYLAAYSYDYDNDQVDYSPQTSFYNYKFDVMQLLDAVDTYASNASEGAAALDNVFNNFVYHLYGNDGNDVLRGGDYADEINGGHGNDTMTGGDGNDIFLFSSDWIYGENGYVAVGPGQDTIMDFDQGHDKISLYQLYATETQSLRFEDFQDLNGKISIVGGDTRVDLGSGDSVTLHGFTGTLTANDFIFQQNNLII